MPRLLFLILLMTFFFEIRTGQAQTVTLDRDQASLQDLFPEIRNQTGCFFYYANSDLAISKPVSIHVSHAALQEVLRICFADQPLTFHLDNKMIVVQKKTSTPAKFQHIRGKILNEQGELLGEVTIAVSGSPLVFTSNGEGDFLLDGITGNAVLIFSHIGYQSQTIALRDTAMLTVILKRLISQLDEVQVIGYGTTTRRLNTGNISSIQGNVIEQQPVDNVLQALEGRMPGVFITQQTGMPGGAINIQIRGQNSLRSDGNYPFYVIDGVPYTAASISSPYTSNSTMGGNPLNEISPDEIERIEILKDADATAIYGSRGANGVVLITTKKGEQGKIKFNLNASSGFAEVPHFIPLLNTSQYLAMRREAFKNDHQVPGPTDYDLNLWDTARTTDWQRELIGGSASQSAIRAAFSGGTKNIQFLLSGSFNKQGTVFPGEQSDRKIALHLALNSHSENKKLNLAFNANYMHDDNRLSSLDLTAMAVTTIPDAPPAYDAAGRLNWSGFFDNPLSYQFRPYESRINNLISDLQISYRLLKGLDLKCNAGYVVTASREQVTNPAASYNPAIGITRGSAIFGQASLDTWILEPQVSYEQNWKDLKFSGVAGTTFQENRNTGQSLLGNDYSNDLLLGTLAGAAEISQLNEYQTLYHYNAFFGRLNGVWKNKFLLNLTGRLDGSSRFGPGKQFASFGSVGAAWIFSQEAFVMRNMGFLSFGKLRASYGSTGSDQIGDYGYLSTYASTTYAYAGAGGLYPTGLFSPDYSWEINRKMEIGLDLGFFRNDLLISAVYYRNRSSNQLAGESLPAITGFSTVQYNLPAIVQNQGMEIECNTVNIKTTDFVWRSSFNLTFPQNKLLAFPGLESSAYADLYEIGKPLSVYKSYHAGGVDPVSGIYRFAAAKEQDSGAGPSYPRDLFTYKSVSQSFYGGLSNSFRYKHFLFDFFLQFVRQTGFNYRYGDFRMPGQPGNQPVYVLDRWQNAGDEKPFEQFSAATNLPAYQAFRNVRSSDLAVDDASFIRLKNVVLAYEFPTAWNKTFHLAAGNVFVKAQNLMTWSGYQGLDPETQSTLHLPVLRVIMFGIQCSF